MKQLARKELAYLKTGTPAFILLNLEHIPDAEMSTGDKVFAYNPQTMLCIGSTGISDMKTAVIQAFGDDPTTPGIENIGYNQSFNFGYFDAQTGRFFKLEADLFNLVGDDINDVPVFMPLNIMTGEDFRYAIAIPSLDENGERIEIELAVDPELTDVKIEFNLPKQWKQGDPKLLPIKPVISNVENVQVELMEGHGELEVFDKQQYFKTDNFDGFAGITYTVHTSDTEVTIKMTGTDKFTGDEVDSVSTMSVEQESYTNVLYENPLMVIYAGEGKYKAYAAAKSDKVLFAIHKQDAVGNDLPRNFRTFKNAFLKDKPTMIGLVSDLTSDGGTWEVKTLRYGLRYTDATELIGTQFTVEGADPFPVVEEPVLPELPPYNSVIFEDEKIGVYQGEKIIVVNKSQGRLYVQIKASAEGKRTAGITGLSLLADTFAEKSINPYYKSNYDTFTLLYKVAGESQYTEQNINL